MGEAALAFSLEEELSVRMPAVAADAASSASEVVQLRGPIVAPDEVDYGGVVDPSETEAAESEPDDLAAATANALALEADVAAAAAAASEPGASNYGSSPEPAFDYDPARGSQPKAPPGGSARAWLLASTVSATIAEGDEAAAEAGGAAGSAGFQPEREYVAFANAIGFQPIAAAPHGRGEGGWNLLHCMCGSQDMASVAALDDIVVGMPEVSEQHAPLAHVNSLVRLFVSIASITNLDVSVCCLFVGVLRPNPSLIRASSTR